MTPAPRKVARKTPMLVRALCTVVVSMLGLSVVQDAAAQSTVRRLTAVPAMTANRAALPGSVAQERLRASVSLGQLPGETQLQGMALYLKPTAAQDAAMTQLLADQQNPASATYHQWLTPEQFGARFGVGDEDLAVLTSWLQARGFTVESVAPSRNRIVFSGTSSAVESAFAVTMQRYQREGRTFFENSTAVQVPAAMADVIGGVTGLSSYRLVAPQQRRMELPQTTQSQNGLMPAYTTSGGNHYLVPWDFRQIFGMNALISIAGFDGTGITIGVIGQSAVDTTQLTYFQQKTGISNVKLPTLTLVPNTGVSNKISGDEGESELDLEYTAGSAPGATINFIYTGCTSTTSATPLSGTTTCSNNGVFDALAYAITTKLANNSTTVIPILTLSYGGCESDFTSFATTGNSAFEGYLKQANTQGQSVLVSSGDTGAATCDQSGSKVTIAKSGLTVSYPASSPYVTAVGGTTLTSDSSTYWSSTNNSFGGSAIGYMPETSWNDTAAYGSIAASGGGASKIFTKPSWQGGTVVPVDGRRDVPDVAFPAGIVQHGYLTCTVDGACTNGTAGFGSGGGGLVGGTSVAAPNFAAMLAVIEQANGGGALGNVDPILYTLAQGPASSNIFHDITTGNNIVSCTGGSTDCSSQTASVQGTMGFSAGVGYDLVTGLGSIDASSLRTALQSVTARTAALALNLSTNTPVIGTAVTFTLTVGNTGTTTGTPTGTVQFAVDGTNVGAAVALSSGVASYGYSGFATVGSHTVTATYSGDSNYNGGTATVTVTATLPVPTITLTPANTLIGLNTAVTYTATVAYTGGATPTGTIQFQIDGNNVGTAVALTSGVATYNYAGSATAGAHTITAVYSGNTTYSATSATTNFTVGSITSFTMAATPTSLTVASGSTGASTLTVTPVNGFSGTVNLTYTVATNSGATFAGCLVATSSALAVSGSPATLPLTVRTTAANCTTTSVLQRELSIAAVRTPVDWHRTGFAVISAAGLLGCCFLRRRLRPGLLLLVGLIAMTAGMAGCGSNATANTTATSGGNYTFTLQGKSGTTTASTTFTLIVQ